MVEIKRSKVNVALSLIEKAMVEESLGLSLTAFPDLVLICEKKS